MTDHETYTRGPEILDSRLCGDDGDNAGVTE